MSTPSRDALVIGAGLAGAAVSVALARRGWTVQLIDAADGPAAAASSLPVGMLSPHVTRAPTPLSRLSALGVACTRAELERLLPQGAGWQAVEVDNRGHDPGRHPAALVRPGALVRAWLDEAVALQRLRPVWKTSVHSLKAQDDGWLACDATGQPLGHARQVVVASALGSLPLLASQHLGEQSLPLRPVQGQMSLAAQDGTALAERPQRDKGVFVPCYEDSGLAPHWPSSIWAMGSTYERGATHTEIRAHAHLRNAEALDALVPAAAERLRRDLADGRLLGWAQVRCASLDRLPLVGRLPDVSHPGARHETGSRRPALEDLPRLKGLCVLTALGSRGLSLAALCGQTLAAMLDGEAPALDADLLRAIDPARFAWRRARSAQSISNH